jgi:hypothetical protein
MDPLCGGILTPWQLASLPILYDFELEFAYSFRSQNIQHTCAKGIASMHVRICFSALILSAAFPVMLHAQFQKPTKEELGMTEDPKAPGAAAVYLSLEEITDDPLHYHSFYARIKVLQE